MGKATYWQRGETIDFKNETGAKIEANTIITLGSRVGIAGTDINPGEVGSLHVTGVFKMDKIAEEIAAGSDVYLDPSGKITKAANTPGEEEGPETPHVKAGFAAEKAETSDAYAIVKINA